MTKIHGHGGAMTTAGTDSVGELQSWNIDEQAAVAQGYSMGDSWQSAEGTVKSWSGSSECYYDPEDAGQISLSPGDRVQLHFYPDGDASGKTYRSGFGVISGTPITANKDGFISITFNFVGDGALAAGTVA